MSTLSALQPAPLPPPCFPTITIEEFTARYASVPAELVRGVVKDLPMVGMRHGKLCSLIGHLIGNHVEAHDLGHVMSNDTWIQTGPASVRGADVLFMSYERLPKDQEVPEGIHSLAPELVVEVKSPSDRWGELFVKVGEYLNAGVRVIVVIDPETSTASVYRDQARQQILDPGDTLTLPDVLPGFAVPVARLFA